MPTRRTRIAALENAARSVIGLPPLRPPTQRITGAGAIASSAAFGATRVAVAARFSMPWESLATVTRTLTLPWESEGPQTKHARGSSRVSAGGGVTSHGHKSSEQSPIDRAAWISEASWLMSTTGFGVTIGGLVGAPTGDSVDYMFSGAIVGWAVGYALWRWRQTG
jgi:hypothetical protein